MTGLFRLPPDYARRPDPAPYLDLPGALVHQPHVYDLLGHLARKAGVRRIIDIGCGAAEKLRPLQSEFEILCIDRPPALELAKNSLPSATFMSWDLENGLPELATADLRDSVVVCADVIEHLRNPQPLACALARLQRECRYLLVSTPDRERARGCLDAGPPANPAHACEWSAGEFGRFLRDCGFPARFFIGHTINNDLQAAKTTTLVIAGREAAWPALSAPVRVAALMHVFNECDILPEVVAHLNEQGVEVHIFDNWSNDGSLELAQELHSRGSCRNVCRFPEAPVAQYELARQLDYSARYAAALDVDWVIHYDADEIRSAPWQGVSLAGALAHVGNLGYNAVEFTVVDFRFLRGRQHSSPPYQQSLNHFEFGRRPGHFAQIKAWRNTGEPVDLVSSGGHDVRFPARRVFPLKFFTKHYPLRTATQAAKKVFHDRLPRFSKEQAERGWHVHYEEFARTGAVPGWEAHQLLPWHPQLFADEYLVERLSGIGIRP
jgi:SAM-dependent methyltransferase